MARPRERVRLEDGLKLDLNKVIRQKLVRPGSKTDTGIRWSYRYLDEEITTGKITADMTYARRGWLRLQFGNLDQWIDLETVPRPFETPRSRALSAAQAIRCKLGGKDYISIDDDMPAKPNWMRWNTYERITRRCEASEAICNLYLLGFLARLKNQH